MDFVEYFINENKHKHYYVKLKNKGVKPITFSWILYDYNFDYFKGKFINELLKMEVLCKNHLQIFKTLYTGYYLPMEHSFWSLKKNDRQYVGYSFKKFLGIITKKEGLIFNYPIINGNYCLLLTGISKKPETFKLFIYFNNSSSAYIDLIDSFLKYTNKLGFEVKLKEIRRVKMPRKFFHNPFKYVPKVQCTLGSLENSEYSEYFYLIHRPKIKINKIVDKISHLIVWWNGEPIRYKENRKFLLFYEGFLNLDEVAVLSFKTLPTFGDLP